MHIYYICYNHIDDDINYYICKKANSFADARVIIGELLQNNKVTFLKLVTVFKYLPKYLLELYVRNQIMKSKTNFYFKYC